MPEIKNAIASNWRILPGYGEIHLANVPEQVPIDRINKAINDITVEALKASKTMNAIRVTVAFDLTIAYEPATVPPMKKN